MVKKKNKKNAVLSANIQILTYLTRVGRAGASEHLLSCSVWFGLQQAAVNPSAGGAETRRVQSARTAVRRRLYEG